MSHCRAERWRRRSMAYCAVKLTSALDLRQPADPVETRPCTRRPCSASPSDRPPSYRRPPSREPSAAQGAATVSARTASPHVGGRLFRATLDYSIAAGRHRRLVGSTFVFKKGLSQTGARFTTKWLEWPVFPVSRSTPLVNPLTTP